MSEALATLISLEHNLRQIKSIDELAFFMVHNAREVFTYEKAIVWHNYGTFRVVPKAISRVSQVDKNSPFSQWISSIIKHIIKINKRNDKPIWQVYVDDLPKELVFKWPEHFSAYLLVCPFKNDYGEINGGILFSVNELPSKGDDQEKKEEKKIEWLANVFNYYWQAICQKSKLTGHWFRWKKGYTWGFMLFVIILMFYPISQSVIAPAMIIAKNPIVITSPMDGVIASFDVAPSSSVIKNQVLFKLDDRDLENAYELAKKEFLTANAKYLKAVQTGFKDTKNRSDINILKAEVAEKQLEVNYTANLLTSSTVRSPENGIAVVDNINEWIGKPIVTGEKIMEIAKENKVELEVWLPVSDAIGFKSGSRVVLFLNAEPLHAINAKIRYISFHAKMTPSKILAYRVIADFNKESDLTIIGSKGSAKLIGEKVTLFYYLFRKPITVLRQHIGW